MDEKKVEEVEDVEEVEEVKEFTVSKEVNKVK